MLNTYDTFLLWSSASPMLGIDPRLFPTGTPNKACGNKITEHIIMQCTHMYSALVGQLHPTYSCTSATATGNEKRVAAAKRRWRAPRRGRLAVSPCACPLPRGLTLFLSPHPHDHHILLLTSVAPLSACAHTRPPRPLGSHWRCQPPP
jgi:hypothetical protein